MVKKIPLETYPIDVYLFRPCTSEEAREYMVKKYAITDAATMFRFDGFSFILTRGDSGAEAFFLWLRHWSPKNGYWPATLAHELGHVVDNIKKYLNITEGETGREVHAYLMSFLYTKCFDQLEQWRRRKHGRRKKTVVVPVNADNAQEQTGSSSNRVFGEHQTWR